jgi:N6-L-threonylcarbamoyladenine synthase
MLILAIESSCDDTAAAVLEPEHRVLSSIISSQNEIHARFGGIVPELASRRHIEMIRPVVDEALSQADVSLDDIDLIAATQGPGLVGSLLVGFTFAKALALVRDLPCVGVDHMVGHLLSCLLEERQPEFPYTALIVSGGNTSLFAVDSPLSFTRLGRTRDDAAGEAFDKVAKLLELGYPGGPVVSRLAREGNPAAIRFPRARLGEHSLDFSFSGLKTYVMNTLAETPADPALGADVARAFTDAVVDTFIIKCRRALKATGLRTLVVAGGVSANADLRAALAALGTDLGCRVVFPPLRLATDNGAMIAYAGYRRLVAGEADGAGFAVRPRWPLDTLPAPHPAD